jgi:hypothetical protein
MSKLDYESDDCESSGSSTGVIVSPRVSAPSQDSVLELLHSTSDGANSGANSGTSSDIVCGVCMLPIVHSVPVLSRVYTTRCGHAFHKGCINGWASIAVQETLYAAHRRPLKLACPVCERKIESELGMIFPVPL